MRVRIWEENGARTEKAPKLWLPLRRESNCVQNGDRALDLARVKVGVGSPCDLSISVAQAAGYQPARLGPRVLRTETAPVVALAVAQQLWGDF